MIVQNCNPLLVVISRIESIIEQIKIQNPKLADEEIIELLKKKFSLENNS